MEHQYKIFQNVRLGKDCVIEPWVQLGVPPRGHKEGDFELVIGDGAHIRSGTVIYAGCTIGNNFATGHNARIQPRVKIGDNVSIGSGSEIEHDVTIANHVRIHSNCFIAQGTDIEDGVKISPGTNITSTKYPLVPEEKKDRHGPKIERNAYVGIGATILSHITIGAGSLVGIGSVVTKDVPPGVIVVGNPAEVRTTVAEHLEKLKVKGYM